MLYFQYINLAKFRFISRNAKCYRVERVDFMENIDYDTTKATKVSRVSFDNSGSSPDDASSRQQKKVEERKAS